MYLNLQGEITQQWRQVVLIEFGVQEQSGHRPTTNLQRRTEERNRKSLDVQFVGEPTNHSNRKKDSGNWREMIRSSWQLQDVQTFRVAMSEDSHIHLASYMPITKNHKENSWKRTNVYFCWKKYAIKSLRISQALWMSCEYLICWLCTKCNIIGILLFFALSLHSI